MKLTRKRAAQMAIDKWIDTGRGDSFTACSEYGVDFGIVLGLQMAAKECAVYGRHNAAIVINEKIARRLKKLEKAK